MGGPRLARLRSLATRADRPLTSASEAECQLWFINLIMMAP
jgi:hypothetical protein